LVAAAVADLVLALQLQLKEVVVEEEAVEDLLLHEWRHHP
jgi:hypothetical protein